MKSTIGRLGQNARTVCLEAFRTDLGCASLFLLLVLLVVLTPYLLWGGGSTFLVHDHLDANVAWATVLNAEGKLFSGPTTVVDGILGGVERRFFAAPTQLYYWFFAIFDPFQAIVLAEVLTRAVGLVGLYLLLTDFVFKPQKNAQGQAANRILAGLLSLWFALLPFWPPGGASVSGVPLFFWAALNARQGQLTIQKKAALVCATLVYAIFADLISSGFFALVFSSTFIVRDVFCRNWAGAIRLTSFNFILSLAFLAQNYGLLRAISSGERTSREEFARSGIEISDFFDLAAKNFFEGQYHADPGVHWPILTATGMALLVFAAGKLAPNGRSRPLHPSSKVLLTALMYLSFTAFAYATFKLSVVQDALGPMGLAAFDFSRFHWMQPALWALVFSSAILVFTSQAAAANAARQARSAPSGGAKKLFSQCANTLVWLPHGLVVIQILYAISDLPAYQNASSKKHASFDAFYAPTMFAQVKSHLAGGDRIPRVGLIGLHPAIAEFNGIATVGGYLAIYPLETKHRFREIIAGELEKDEELRTYFDEWGSRAYLFSKDLNKCRFMCWADVAPQEIEVAYDIAAFKNFGGSHIVSVSKIKNATDIGLIYIDTIGAGDKIGKHWKVHLYAAQ